MMFVKNTCCPSSSFAMILLASSSMTRLLPAGLCPAGRLRGAESWRREILAQFEYVRADAFGDFGAVVTVRVVGANHQHDGLGFVALAFAILEAPEHSLGGIARHAEVRDFLVAEILGHGALAPRIAERIAVGGPSRYR